MASPSPMETSLEIPFELDALREAKGYRTWLYDKVAPHLGNRILELGSGIGNLSQHLPLRERLILSDVEVPLVQHLKRSFESPTEPRLSVMQMEPSASFPEILRKEDLDTIVSFNVLEHVANDAALLRDCIQLLESSNTSGPKRIVSLVPAMEFAYGSFDRVYGHHRRYSIGSYRRMLIRAGAKPNDENLQFTYMNLVGLLGWLINGRLLKKEKIEKASVQAFERLVPILRPFDDLTFKYLRLPFGNSLVAVYEVKK